MNVLVLARVPATPLEELLLARAREWAQAVAPGSWTQAEAVAAAGEGPLLIVSPDAPRLSPAHAEVARLDLDSGADVSLGPTFGGGLYMVAMRELRPDLLPADWRAPTAFAEAIALAHGAGLELGWMRMERAAVGEADRRALRADPLVDPEIRALL